MLGFLQKMKCLKLADDSYSMYFKYKCSHKNILICKWNLKLSIFLETFSLLIKHWYYFKKLSTGKSHKSHKKTFCLILISPQWKIISEGGFYVSRSTLSKVHFNHLLGKKCRRNLRLSFFILLEVVFFQDFLFKPNGKPQPTGLVE